MVQCIVQRRTSIFASAEWLSDPWCQLDKTLPQKVFDYGLLLGGIYERADQLSLAPNVHPQTQAKLLHDCASAFEGVQELLEEIQVAVFDDPNSEVLHLRDRILLKGHTLHSYPPICITGWAIQVALCATSFDILSREWETAGPPIRNKQRTNIPAAQFRNDAFWIDETRMHLTRQILDSSSFFLFTGIGMDASSRLIFPLRTALEQFEQSSDEFSRCKALIAQLEQGLFQGSPELHRNESVACYINHCKATVARRYWESRVLVI